MAMKKMTQRVRNPLKKSESLPCFIVDSSSELRWCASKIIFFESDGTLELNCVDQSQCLSVCMWNSHYSLERIPNGRAHSNCE